jgi:hypothetical protein
LLKRIIGFRCPFMPQPVPKDTSQSKGTAAHASLP